MLFQKFSANNFSRLWDLFFAHLCRLAVIQNTRDLPLTIQVHTLDFAYQKHVFFPFWQLWFSLGDQRYLAQFSVKKRAKTIPVVIWPAIISFS